MDGQFAGVEVGDVIFPLVHVLIVDALEMAEGCDACADQVRTAPEAVAVDKTGMGGGFDQRVGAADFVSVGFELAEGVIDPERAFRPSRRSGFRLRAVRLWISLAIVVLKGTSIW